MLLLQQLEQLFVTINWTRLARSRFHLIRHLSLCPLQALPPLKFLEVGLLASLGTDGSVSDPQPFAAWS